MVSLVVAAVLVLELLPVLDQALELALAQLLLLPFCAAMPYALE